MATGGADKGGLKGASPAERGLLWCNRLHEAALHQECIIMPKAFKLNDTETAILVKASTRRNGSIIPLPEGSDPTAAKTKRILGRLLAANLIEERSTPSTASAWRTDDAGHHFTLRITALGRTALSKPPSDSQPVSAPQEQPIVAATRVAEPRGKLGAILSAVRHADGAALGELVALTGWQPHTVRASLTRLRQSGFSIQMTTTDNGRRYFTEGATCEARP
jgi:hypothetical protein